MNTAEQLEPTLTEQIKAEQSKLRLMRQRSTEATNITADYQKTLDKLRDESDQAFYLHTSQPSKAHDKAYTDAKNAVLKLTSDYEEALAVKRRLPDRLKNAERLIHSLQRQKQEKVHALANQKLGKKKEIAMEKASEAICAATALTAATSPGGDLDKFLGLGNLDIHSLVTRIVSTPEFRQSVSTEFNKLVKSLRIEEV